MDYRAYFNGRNLIKDEHQFERYIKLINYLPKDLVKSGDGTKEMHHILPKKIFPEFKKEKWNMIVVDSRAHYILHYLLFKSIKHSSCVYSFNQMRRISKARGISNCRLYKAVKIYFATLISENNTGRVVSPKQKEMLSERFKGTNICRNIKSGELLRFPVNFIPEGWESFQTGRIRTEESKAKLGKSMGGRIWCFCEDTRSVLFTRTPPNDYTIGFPPWFEISSTHINDSIWVSNSDGEELRIPKDSIIPVDFKKGRKFDNRGFNSINNSSLVKAINLKTKKYEIISLTDYDKIAYYIKSGLSPAKIYVVCYDGIYYQLSKFIEMFSKFCSLKNVARNDTLLDFRVRPPHPIHTIDQQKFSDINRGKTLREMGVIIFNLSSYTYSEEHIWVR